MDSKWGGGGGSASSGSGFSSTTHRLSLRPGGGSTSPGLASRYGLTSTGTSASRSNGAASSSSASSGAATGMGANISSSVASFMRKVPWFAGKASTTNSIDSSFKQYQKELQQQQAKQTTSGGASGSASGYASTSAGPVFASVSSGASAGLSSSQTAQSSATAAAFPLSHHSDTGYSSNANSPATTPTVSSISASPIPPAQLSSSFTSPYGSSSNVDGAGGSRPSSAASSTTASTQRGPLFSKIRAKMASTFSGQPQSAVESPLGSGPPTPIPSLLQSNAPSSSISAHLSTLARPDSVSSTFTSTLDAQQRQQRSSSITSQTGGGNFTGPNTSPGSGDGSGSQRPPMLSMLSQSHSSSLTNEQLTAHLTEEEKKILEKVFQKEEEFREIALKNFVKSTTMTEGSSNTASASQPNTSNLLPTGSPVSGVSHLSTNLLDPVAAAVHRRRSSAIMSADATGFCRICRKVIMKDEASHRCSNCQELVCDDCSSYSSREESKYWMCSFCRRRGSHLILTTTTTSDTSTTTSTMASSLFSTLTATASSLIPSMSAAPPSQPSISINVPKSPQPSPPPPARSTTTSTPQQPPPSPHPLLSATTSATLQPTSASTTAKRKSSFSECQIRQHDAISNQRQSSLDLQKTQILLQQRKSAQFTQSPLLYQAAQTAQAQAQQAQQQQTAQQAQWNEPSNKMPRVELPPPEEPKHAQPALGEAHPSAYYSTSVNQGATIIQQSPTSNVHQLAPTPTCSNMTSPSLTSATSTTTPTTIALSPQNGNARTRIYSLSDDEELLSDDEDDDEEDDDEDEDFDNDEDDEEEEELFEEDAEEYGKEEFSRRLKQHRKTHHRKFSLQKASPITKETTLDEIAEIPFEKCLPSKRSRKRPKQNGKSHHKGGLSPHKDDYEAYVHMIGGPSHGTLASVPAETLKRRRSSKRKKKKASHHGASYNSDDELMTTSASVKQQQEQDQQEIAQYMNNNGGQGMFGPGRRDSGAGLLQQPLPMIPHGNLTTFADVVNTVTSGSLLHQRASFSGFSGAQPFAGLQRMGSGYYGTGKPLSAMQQMHRPSQAVASKWWRLSKKVGSMSRTGQIGLHDSAIFNYGVGLRQRKSSESSDVSDVRYSPPQDSLTPSSEYSRSPRESADSEMLGLTYSGLAMQRRSIPSVLVDVGGDGLPMGCQPSGYFLSLKDCYNRRGSAGRALPQIPVEPSRSMLDLPHSRKSSAHSLDIPMEQPRRASAPEGENIRIVIDEVQDVTGSHPELLTQGGSCDPDSERTYSRSGSARASSGAIVPLQPTVITQVQVAPQGQTSYQQRMRAQLTRAASIVTHYERVILKREDSDLSNRTRGFGLSVIGGRLNEQDGMLYAYVNWSKPGGQADKQGLKPGDKILEWNSKSLVNCSYEQVCNIIDTSGESAELIVESMVKCDPALQKQRRRESLAAQQAAIAAAAAASGQQIPPTSGSATHSTHHQEKLRPSSAAATLVPTSTSPTPPRSAREAREAREIREDREERTGSGGSSASATPRRRLPAIPKSPKSASTATYLAEASILLQVTMDTNIRQLSVVIVSAKGLEQHPLYQTGLSGNIPPNEAYAQLRLLPEMGFKVCQTELNFNFEWNETLIYHQFPLERVDEITLDLSVWTTNSTSMAPFYQHHHNIPTPSPQIRVRSPRHSSVGLPVAPQISITSDHSSTYQLASTRIPLRSALFQLSEWWPLIPTEVNYVQGPPPKVVVPAPLDLSGSGGSSGMSVPSPAPNMPSTAPPVFFHKAPSMDYIDISSGNLLGDTIMMSRSTPGSRRNSGRSESGMEMIIEASPCTEQAGTQSGAAHGTTTTTMSSRPIVFSGYQRPPTRGSTATLSSSTGRHSLDDSSYSNSVGGGPKSGEGGGSLSLGRSTSLRLVQNRHSVGNVYNMPSTGDSSVLIATAYTRGPHLAAPNQDYERRKSSSALGQSGTKINSNLAPGGVPAFVGGYSRFTGDSTQFLLMSQQQLGPGQSAQQISSQETSPLSSDDDIDNLLLEDSNLESDTTPNRPSVPFPNYRPQSSASMMSSSQQQQSQLPETAKKHSDPKLNQLTVIDSNKLSIASIDDPSRYSGTASPVTPSNEDEPDEGSGSLSSQNLLAPNWASTGRRKSFLQRLMPSGVSAGAAALLHKDHDQSFASSEHAQTKSVVVGEIKLGFIMTKGFLEIEVIAARGLSDSVTGPYAPDTYVKTYVYDRGRQLYKRKTRVVSGDKSPQYRQTLKYDANIIYGRSILVSVWEKQKRTFEPNVPIGATEINVNQLELHKLTIRWYRLRSFVSPSSDHGGMGAGEGPMGALGTSAPSTSAQETSGSQQQPTSEQQQRHQQHPQRSMLPSV